MKNKEDVFLVGLIVVIIVLVVALFMTPTQIAEVNLKEAGQASIDIANPPREAIIVETVKEPEAVVEPEEEPEPVVVEEIEEPEIHYVEINNGIFTPNDLTIESGDMVVWENVDSMRSYQIVFTAYNQNTYSPKMRTGDTYSRSFEGPIRYYFHATGYERKKARLIVEG
jgi:plastocyanin|tara:strand:- start:5667 stop:6173 length:507 start_codon:yes stop_codon:yes gene_type:complete